jgi:hypothetical protein
VLTVLSRIDKLLQYLSRNVATRFCVWQSSLLDWLAGKPHPDGQIIGEASDISGCRGEAVHQQYPKVASTHVICVHANTDPGGDAPGYRKQTRNIISLSRGRRLTRWRRKATLVPTIIATSPVQSWGTPRDTTRASIRRRPISIQKMMPKDTTRQARNLISLATMSNQARLAELVWMPLTHT